MLQARLATALAERDAAIAERDQALSQNHRLQHLLQQLRRPAEALPYFQRHLDMVEDDVQTLVQIGKCYIDLNRLDEAEAALRSALAAGDDAIGFYNLGIVLEQRGRLDEAERSYRRAVELGPGLATARSNLAGLLAQRGKLDEAAALLIWKDHSSIPE